MGSPKSTEGSQKAASLLWKNSTLEIFPHWGYPEELTRRVSSWQLLRLDAKLFLRDVICKSFFDRVRLWLIRDFFEAFVHFKCQRLNCPPEFAHLEDQACLICPCPN